jgi:hypothetical protein
LQRSNKKHAHLKHAIASTQHNLRSLQNRRHGGGTSNNRRPCETRWPKRLDPLRIVNRASRRDLT